MADRAVDDNIVYFVAIPVVDDCILTGALHASVNALVSVPTPVAVGETHEHEGKLVDFVLV